MTDGAEPWSPISEETVRLLAGVGTTTLASQLLKRGLRDQFIAGVRPLSPESRLVGTAWTLRCIPAREDLDGLLPGTPTVPGLSLHSVIDNLPAGATLVVDARGETRTATGGDLLIERLKTRGARGLITDAGLRDSSGIVATGIPCYAASVTANVSRAYLRVIDQDIPIGCGGVAVYPGDAVVGDGDGAIVVPRSLVDPVAKAAAEQEQLEAYLAVQIREGRGLKGVYPPNETTLDDYRRSQSGAA